MNTDTFRKKMFLVAGVLVFVGIVWIIWFIAAGPASKTTVEIFTVPSDATLTIDGKEVKQGKISLSKGEHTLKATRQYFDDAEKTIQTDTLNTTDPVYLLLPANTPEAQKYILESPEDQMLYERAVAVEISNKQSSLLERHPYLSKLPYKTLRFTIDYSVDAENNPHFTVEMYSTATVPGTPEYKEQLQHYKALALEFFNDNGVDPAGLDIRYIPDEATW